MRKTHYTVSRRNAACGVSTAGRISSRDWDKVTCKACKKRRKYHMDSIIKEVAKAQIEAFETQELPIPDFKLDDCHYCYNQATETHDSLPLCQSCYNTYTSSVEVSDTTYREINISVPDDAIRAIQEAVNKGFRFDDIGLSDKLTIQMKRCR